MGHYRQQSVRQNSAPHCRRARHRRGCLDEAIIMRQHINKGPYMINLIEDIKPVSYIKTHANDVLKQIKGKNKPVIITQNGEAAAVLMNVNYYQDMVDAINLLKILSIGEDDIKKGKIISEDEMDRRIEKIFE
jgi:PHD/YefM family antitoxin component YafN of YafNO toxin-antitoxin module